MKRTVLLLPSLLGCAAAQPMEPVVGPTPMPIAAAERSVPPPARPAPGGAELGADGIARLCETLRDEDGIPFEGNDVLRARAREEHQRRRVAAADAGYVAVVPPPGFRFRGYDIDERRMSIDTSRAFVLADGVELFAADRDTAVSFELAPDAAEALLKDHASGGNALRLVFRPARSDMRKDVCVRASGGRVVRLPVAILSFALLGRDGTPVAQGQTAELAEVALATTPVATPEVRVGRPRTEEGREVSDQVAAGAGALGPALLPCYEKALQQRPTLRGTLVLDLRVVGDGRVEAPRMEMSSLGDEVMVACAVARTAKARLTGIAGPVRLSLPVAFGAKEDR